MERVCFGWRCHLCGASGPGEDPQLANHLEQKHPKWILKLARWTWTASGVVEELARFLESVTR